VGSERRFTLKRELGSGAFGTVYLAEMESMGGFKKDVAVKLLNESLGNFADASKRLRDEARLLGKLQHRNIVRVDDLLRLDGRWAIVMEHIQGYDLELVIRAREELGEAMGPVAVMEVVFGVAGALDAAWSSKAGGEEPLCVVHRDIKPSNIRLTHSGEVKVLDFGIARAEFSGREALTGQIRYGSLGYLSPERLIGEPEVPAGDVFAVGCVAYELLVGEALGRVELKPESQGLQVQAALDRVRATLEGQPPEAVEQWLALLEGCLAYEVDDRPTSGELAAGAKALAKKFEGEALHVFSERALAKLPQVFDDQTRPARGVLTEEGLTTGGNPAPQKPVSNPTLVFDDFGPGLDEVAEAVAGTSKQAAAPAGQVEEPPLSKRDSRAWIVGATFALLIGVGIFTLTRPKPAVPVEPSVDQAVNEVDPAGEAPNESDPTAAVEPVDKSTESVVAVPVEPLAADKTPVKTREPKADPAPESVKEPEVEAVLTEPVLAGPRLRSAKFSVPGASSVSVTCGDVSSSGSGSVLLRELPAGNCSVRAEVDGVTFKGSAKVTKPSGITCTPTEGALTCR
jgi:serine/threonine protein kinase